MSSEENTAERIVVFEGDPGWISELHGDLGNVELLTAFFAEFDFMVDHDDLEAAIKATPGIAPSEQ